MEQYYVMHRTGQFKPAKFSSNQCKGPGHDKYHYELVMVFNGDASLDKDYFLLDHQNVDDVIQKMRLGGSCEQMHLKISRAISKLMKDHNLPMVACKCILRPTIPDGAAWMKFVSFEPGYQHTVALT